MADVITRNSSPTVELPGLVLVTVYDATQPLGTILHAKMNGSGFNVTYKPARLSSGTLSCVFATAADAKAAADLLATPYNFALESVESEVDMTFVAQIPTGSGQLRVRPGEGADEWVVDVPFQEVTP